MSARDKILDAYEAILISEGERAATLEAVAARAEVSKGGLLYHFKDKTALADALVARFEAYADEDLRLMREADEGAARYYVRSSLYEDMPFDKTLVAAARLSREAHPSAAAAVEEVHRQWYSLIVDQVGDEARARAILLIGDGLYYNAAIDAGGMSEAARLSPQQLENLLLVVDRLTTG